MKAFDLTAEMPTLTGPRVTLRSPRDSDAAEKLAQGQDDEILKGFGMVAADLPPVSEESCAQWLAEQRDAYSWIIEIGGALAGTVRLHSIWFRDARASYAVGFTQTRYLGQGYGQEVTRLVLDHGFGDLGLHRISLRVMANNARAIGCYEACGFKREGVEREAGLMPDGNRVDDIMMGLLAPEWTAQ